MNINKNTIIVTVGPSCCGKSYWSDRAIKQLKSKDISVELLSTDTIRRELLGKDYDKHEAIMCSVSNQAFDMLYNRLRNFSSYPVNKEVIIVDSTGLSPDFRNKVARIAEENNYSVCYVVFDYEDESTFYLDRDNSIVRDHVKNFKKERNKKLLIKQASKKNTSKIVFKNRDDVNASEIIMNDQAKKIDLLTNDYLVVGDVHGSREALLNLLDYSHKIKKFKTIIFVGDIVDKGPKDESLKIMKMLMANDEFMWCRGNHEHFHKAFLTERISIDQSVLDKYFNQVSKEDKEFNDTLLKFYDNGYDFIKTPTAIITHAPCQKKFLGKSDKASIKAQRNFRYMFNEGEPVDIKAKLSFLDEEDYRWYKTHIFGHVAFKQPAKGKSFLGIDTGAVYGNKLTAAYFDEKALDFKTISVPAPKLAEGNLYDF